MESNPKLEYILNFRIKIMIGVDFSIDISWSGLIHLDKKSQIYF